MLEPSLTEPRVIPSKASSQYSPASSRAEQSLEYRHKPNRIEPDLSRAEPNREWRLDPSRVGYRAKTLTEPSRAELRAKPARIRVARWAWVRPRAKWSLAPYETPSQASPELLLNKAEWIHAQQNVFPFQSAISIRNRKLSVLLRHAASGHYIGTGWFYGIQTMFAPKLIIAPPIFSCSFKPR